MKFAFSTITMLASALAAGFAIPSFAAANTGENDWTLSSTLTDFDTEKNTGSKTLDINIGRCKELLEDAGEETFYFNLNNTAALSSGARFSIKHALGNDHCEKKLERDSSDTCENITNNESLTASSVPIAVKRRVSALSSATSADECENLAETSYIYLIVSDSSTGIENIYTVTYVLDFRTTRPSAPENVTATAGGSSIDVSWDAVDGAISYNVYYVKEGADPFADGDAPENVSAKSITATKSSASIKDGIAEDTNYIIGVTALDKAGNESLIGGVTNVMTVTSTDFWESFREQNKDVDGGFCFIATAAWGSTQEPHVALLRQFRDDILKRSSVGRTFIDTYYKLSPPAAYFIGHHPTARAVTRTLLWPLYGMAYLALNAPLVLGALFLAFCTGLVLLGVALHKRRQKTNHLNNNINNNHTAAKTSLLALFMSSAALFTAPTDALADNDESSVNMMFELKAGMYTPDELGDAYKTHFKDNNGFIVEGEYDWQFYRGVGSLGLGFHLAYGRVSGHCVDDSGNETVDETAINWLPLRLSLVYRFDYLWTRFNVPLTIYVKPGIDYYIYWIRNGADSIASDENGNKGYGGTFGFHVVAGLAFVLDWLAPEMAKSFDVEWGVNNSYLFAEFMYANINNFYSGGAFELTDKATFEIGIGLEF